jgi:hypothetical protein
MMSGKAGKDSEEAEGESESGNLGLCTHRPAGYPRPRRRNSDHSLDLNLAMKNRKRHYPGGD